MKKVIIITGVVVVGVIVSAIVGFYYAMNSLGDFQDDADVVRLQHIKHYGELIEEYKAKVGKYPMEGVAEVPTYVHIANTQQQDDVVGGPSAPHKVVSVKDFFAELERGLGRDIDELYDLQYEPSGRPNFYLYMIYQETWFLAVHLHKPFPFAKTVARNYHKLEISNHPNPQNQAITLSDLLASPKYKEAVQKPLRKPGFVKDRRSKHLRDSTL